MTTRRGFAAALIAGGGALKVLAQEARQGTTADTPPFHGSLEFSFKQTAARVQPFAMTQVRLLPGPYQQAQEWNRAYLKRLSADRLLHNFRTNAGLSSDAKPMGGWEEPKGELRGHFTGHFLSACGLHVRLHRRR